MGCVETGGAVEKGMLQLCLLDGPSRFKWAETKCLPQMSMYQLGPFSCPLARTVLSLPCCPRSQPQAAHRRVPALGTTLHILGLLSRKRQRSSGCPGIFAQTRTKCGTCLCTAPAECKCQLKSRLCCSGWEHRTQLFLPSSLGPLEIQPVTPAVAAKLVLPLNCAAKRACFGQNIFLFS